MPIEFIHGDVQKLLREAYQAGRARRMAEKQKTAEKQNFQTGMQEDRQQFAMGQEDRRLARQKNFARFNYNLRQLPEDQQDQQDQQKYDFIMQMMNPETRDVHAGINPISDPDGTRAGALRQVARWVMDRGPKGARVMWDGFSKQFNSFLTGDPTMRDRLAMQQEAADKKAGAADVEKRRVEQRSADWDIAKHIHAEHSKARVEAEKLSREADANLQAALGDQEKANKQMTDAVADTSTNKATLYSDAQKAQRSAQANVKYWGDQKGQRNDALDAARKDEAAALKTLSAFGTPARESGASSDTGINPAALPPPEGMGAAQPSVAPPATVQGGAMTNDQRRAYLSRAGWQAGTEPTPEHIANAKALAAQEGWTE
jgi:hypothetical protein